MNIAPFSYFASINPTDNIGTDWPHFWIRCLLCLILAAGIGVCRGQTDSIFQNYQSLPPNSTRVDSGNVWVKQMAPRYPEQAMNMAKDNLQLARQLGYEEGIIWSLARMGWAQDFGGQPDSAEFYYTLAADQFSRIGLLGEAADNLNNLGVVHLIQSEFEPAIQAFEQTLDLRESLKDTLGMSKVYNNLGLIYKRNQQLSMAIDYFQRATQLKTAVGDTLGLMKTYSNLANALQRNGQLEESVVMSRQMVALMESKGHTEMIGPELVNLATTLKMQGKIQEAEAIYRDGIARLQNHPQQNYNDLEVAYHNLGQLLNDQQRYREALEPLKAALALGESLAKPEVVQASHYQLARTWAGLGEWKKAYQMLDAYSEAEDERARQEMEAALADRVVRYQLDSIQQAEAAKSALETERRLAAEAIRDEQVRQNQYLWTGAVIISILFVIALVLFIVNRRNELRLRRNSVLLEASLREKELLMREVHHRVNNNIQSIRSMLNIQRRKSASSELAESLDQVLNRINAMALIHSRLYGRTSIQDLHLNDYLEDLSEKVFKTLGLKDHHLEFHFSVAPLQVPVDTLLTVGLIVNELLTNSGKYGRGENGILTVGLEVEQVEQQMELRVWDKGTGQGKEKNDSFGFSMLEALVRKLRGEMVVLRNAGYRTEIQLPIHGESSH